MEEFACRKMYKNQLNIVQCRNFNSVQQISIAFLKMVSLRKRKGAPVPKNLNPSETLWASSICYILSYSFSHHYGFRQVTFHLFPVYVSSSCYSVALEDKSLGGPTIFSQHPFPCPIYSWP